MNEQEKARLAELQKTDEAEIYPHLDAILYELDDTERKYIEDSKIVIPEGAPEIAPKLFRNCSQETEVEIPE